MVSSWKGDQHDVYDGAVARSLNEARRDAAERTAESIASLERDGVLTEEETPRERLIDRRELTGWPAAGKGIGGAIHGTQPGHGLFDDECRLSANPLT